jgi:hypothetical protein
LRPPMINSADMEPIRHTLTARLKYLKMYREDVDQLVAIFVQGCEKVIISDSKYRYNSLDEMKEKAGPRVKDLDIRGENPGVHFLFNQTEITKTSAPVVYNELRTEEIADPADGVFYKIKDFIAAYEQPQFVKKWIFPLLVSLAGIFWFALHNSYVDKNGQTVVGSQAGVFICIVAMMISLVLTVRVTNHLSLETKRNSPSFVAKNWEDVTKHWIIALGTGIVGWLIGHFGK